MNKLLRANFARLKSKVFWMGIIFFAGFGLFERVMIYKNDDMSVNTLDDAFFFCALFIGVAMAVFCSLFVGAEYSDGTFRNKIIIGHTRTSIYLSNLIVCTIAGLLFYLTYIAASLLIGIPLLGFFKTDIMTILYIALSNLILLVAYSAIFVLIAMLNQNKAVVAVISILLAFSFLFAAFYIYTRLSEPETYDLYDVSAKGEVETDETVQNPTYLHSEKRAVYEFLYDFLPGCQSIRFSSMLDTPEVSWRLPLYSLFIALVSTIYGVLIFRKKDIK